MEKILNGFEVAITVLILIVITLKIVETSLVICGVDVVILNMEFIEILSIALGFVIGIEFVKMLCKHTPNSVVDVLVFAISRQIIIYHPDTLELLVGVGVIAALFATRKFLIGESK